MKPILAASLALTLATSAEPSVSPTTPLRVDRGTVVATWQRHANPKKPYLAQLFAPGEKPIPLLEDSPADHVHHHGLMLALGADGSDFWTEVGANNIGIQQPSETTPFATGDGFTQILRWTGSDGARLLDETRTVRVRTDGKGAEAIHWLDWQSTLTPAPGRDSVKLWGRHYFGLGLRFLPEWSNHGRFLWQDTTGQTTVRGDEKLTPGLWCAVTHDPGGSPVTVLMLSHPGNPRPGAWFTMAEPFCYLSATYDLENKPAVLAKGESWTLRHSLAVLSKPADAKELDRLAVGWKSTLASRFPIQIATQKP